VSGTTGDVQTGKESSTPSAIQSKLLDGTAGGGSLPETSIFNACICFTTGSICDVAAAVFRFVVPLSKSHTSRFLMWTYEVIIGNRREKVLESPFLLSGGQTTKKHTTIKAMKCKKFAVDKRPRYIEHERTSRSLI
jgi:hypothetical protein